MRREAGARVVEAGSLVVGVLCFQGGGDHVFHGLVGFSDEIGGWSVF